MQKKPEYYELKREPYGKNHPLLKNYVDTAKYNLEPNTVDFELYSLEKTTK